MFENLDKIIFTNLTLIPKHTELWAGFGGAILGAVIGGGISYLIQLKVLRENERMRIVDNIAVKQSLARSLIFIMIAIHSDIKLMNQHLNETFDYANQQGHAINPWTAGHPH